MARGRKPKPVELRDAEGNLSRRPLPAPILKNVPLTEEPPATLGPEGAELWRELVGRLGSSGALDVIDRTALTAMCLQWDIANDARRVREAQGLFSPGSSGQLAQHPAVAIERNAHLMMLRYAAEYGATPVARTRIATVNAEAAAAAELEATVDGEAIEIGDFEEIDLGEL
jgi:P27 family predicted phage terminase small subunit